MRREKSVGAEGLKGLKGLMGVVVVGGEEPFGLSGAVSRLKTGAPVEVV